MTPTLPLADLRPALEMAADRRRLVFALKALITGFVALAIFAVVLAWQVGRAQDAARRAGLAEANARARADSSRAIAGAALEAARKLYGDSIAGATRLVVQERQRADGLDRALGQQRAAIASLAVSVRSLEARVAGAGSVHDEPAGGVEGNPVTRSQTFAIAETPYRGTADVVLPPPPAPGSLALRLTVDPAPIALRIGCSDSRNAGGIRDARATAVGPAWLTVRIDSTAADPDVCNPPPGRRFPWLPWALAAAEGALLILRH